MSFQQWGARHLLALSLCTLALPVSAQPARPGQACQTDPLPEWSEPEQWAWTQICESRSADFNTRHGEALDPKSSDGWTLAYPVNTLTHNM